MHPRLAAEIEKYKADYEALRNQPFEHFYCPILRRDEQVEMCKAHIENEAFNTSKAWVPQRKDVDNFYGSVCEAELVAIVEDRKKNAIDLLADRKTRKRHGFKVLVDGEEVEHYFPRDDAEGVAGQSIAQVVNDGQTVCNVAVKMSSDILADISDDGFQLILAERDYRPSITGAVIKAAHLTMFRMLGYEYVFSAAGYLAGDVLKRFFEKQQGSIRSTRKEDVEKYFLEHVSMTWPMYVEDNILQGTVSDNRLICCFQTNGKPFAVGVVVRAGRDKFCVLLPADQGIDAYMNFLKEPPPSVAVKIAQFDKGDDANCPRWEMSPGEPARFPVGIDLPKDE